MIDEKTFLKFLFYLFFNLKSIILTIVFFFKPDKPKGISHLIETKNPNRVEQKPKTVTEGEAEENPTLSRRER